MHGFEKKTTNIAAQIPQSTGFARHAVDSSISSMCRCFLDPLCWKAMDAPFKSFVPHVSACVSVDGSTELWERFGAVRYSMVTISRDGEPVGASWVSQPNDFFPHQTPRFSPSKSIVYVISARVKPSTTHNPKAFQKATLQEHPEHPTAEEIEDTAPGEDLGVQPRKSMDLAMDLAMDQWWFQVHQKWHVFSIRIVGIRKWCFFFMIEGWSMVIVDMGMA